jgi:quercetin dioxygenase-like cupin family protein
MASEDRTAVAGALAGLEPAQRELIESAFFQGYSQSELAARFNLPLGTVKTRIRRGRDGAARLTGAHVRGMSSELEDWAALDALSALDAETRGVYLARLARAGEAERAAVTEIYEVAARLAIASVQVVAPPPGLKERIMARAATTGRLFTIRESEGEWKAPGIKGITMKVLSIDRERRSAVLLVRAEPGAVYPSHRHSGAEECYVISGEIVVQGQRLRAGDFHHADAGSAHDPLFSDTGAEVMLVVDPADYFD